MPTNRETRQQGKQYDHPYLRHGNKSKIHHQDMLEHHHGDKESGYKHPHEEGHENPFPQFGG